MPALPGPAGDGERKPKAMAFRRLLSRARVGTSPVDMAAIALRQPGSLRVAARSGVIEKLMRDIDERVQVLLQLFQRFRIHIDHVARSIIFDLNSG